MGVRVTPAAGPYIEQLPGPDDPGKGRIIRNLPEPTGPGWPDDPGNTRRFLTD